MPTSKLINWNLKKVILYLPPQCGKKFKSATSLNIHSYSKHQPGSVERAFSCDECGLAFKTSNHLLSHKTIHMPSEQKKFVCDVCKKRYAFKYLLTAHMSSAHSDEKRFACDLCDGRFKTSTHFKDHCLRKHGGVFI